MNEYGTQNGSSVNQINNFHYLQGFSKTRNSSMSKKIDTVKNV